MGGVFTKKYEKEQVVGNGIISHDVANLAETGVFFAGGRYMPSENELAKNDVQMTGQCYIEAYIPKEIRHPYPILMIEGNNQTGVGYMQTLDGRAGWAYDFLKQGFVVYVMDQPARGRSVSHQCNGVRHVWPANATAALFSCTGDVRHTRWPGAGTVGDPIYDQFYASQVDAIRDLTIPQQMIREAAKDLFEKTGPMIVLCHSQSGPFGWILGNDHPEMVKGIISIEPSGPPFTNIRTGEMITDTAGNPVNYGITNIPLDFEPKLESPAQFKLIPYASNRPGKIDGYLQSEPAYSLPKLKNIPILMVTSETSYHAPFDHLTVAFLKQAGANVDFVELQDKGIHGNGHMMMIEENSQEIAAVLVDWLNEQNL